MKALIISDTHFGCRNFNLAIDKFFQDYYTKFFFPLVDKIKPDVIFDAGDTFDARKIINFQVLKNCREYYFDPLYERGIETHIIQGNHTTFFRNTNDVNALDLLLPDYKNVHVYSVPQHVTFGESKVLMFPWMPNSDQDRWNTALENTDAKLMLGHFDLIGADYGHGVNSEGFSTDDFRHIPLVISGHIHKRQRLKNVVYVGNPYDTNWGEWNQAKGVHTLDLETLELEFHPSPLKLFHRTVFSPETHAREDLECYEGKFVQVVIDGYRDDIGYKKFIERLSGVAAQVTIREYLTTPTTSHGDIDCAAETQDTPSIIKAHVHSMSIPNNKKENLTNVLLDLYARANELEIED